MCIGVLYVHDECRHQKKFDCVETCDQYSRKDKTCSGTCAVIHTIEIREPALCVGCFRRVEADTVHRYEQTIKTVEGEIYNCTVALRAELDPQKRKELKDHRSALVEEIGDLKDARNEEIAEFRTKHGVWADG